MMRFIVTILVWVVVIGGLLSYSRQRTAAEANIVRQAPKIEEARQVYSLRLTPTFSIEEDPFALQSEESSNAGIELRINGEDLPVGSGQLQRGRTLSLENIEGLAIGENEIYINASPPLSESGLTHGMRVQLFQAGVSVVDDTVWGEQGALVAGTIHFELEGTGEEHDH